MSKSYDSTVLPDSELNLGLTKAIQTFNKGKISAILVTPTKKAIASAVYQALINNIENGNIQNQQDIEEFISAIKSIGAKQEEEEY